MINMPVNHDVLIRFISFSVVQGMGTMIVRHHGEGNFMVLQLLRPVLRMKYKRRTDPLASKLRGNG